MIGLSLPVKPGACVATDWRIRSNNDPLPSGPELAFYHGIASLTLAGDIAFLELRAAFNNDPRFHAALEILS